MRTVNKIDLPVSVVRVSRCGAAASAAVLALCLCLPLSVSGREDLLQTHAPVGRFGGRLIISQRGEPQTFNPVVANDTSSREILSLTTADLIHINSRSLKTEPALAASWDVSPDSREYTLHLRRGIRFSDGHAFDADDVLFTFKVHLDERVHSSQRDLLIIAGEPVQLEKLDAYTVRFRLPRPYAPGERLFDGFAILPRHRLQASYETGVLDHAWGLNTAPEQMAGLGPFRFKAYAPGQQVRLERNPYYWKKNANGTRLPYLDGVTAVFSGDADTEAMRFQAGELDLVSRLSGPNFSALGKRAESQPFHLYDAGPGFEYTFLFFNLNQLSTPALQTVAAKQSWFRQLEFRKAVSMAIEREAIARLAYHGHARALWYPVLPANTLWVNRALLPQPRDLAGARTILQKAGFSWSNSAQLLDARGKAVAFSLLVNASNVPQAQSATLIQEDLRQLGIDARIVPLEFHAFVDRIFRSYDYEAAIMSLAAGDADPNSEMNIWRSGGSAHVWDLTSQVAREQWQKEIDDLMTRQMTTLRYVERKAESDRVQELIGKYLPLICLVNADVLVGATKRLQNFAAGILGSQTLWNVEELYLGS
jgi:peptide/nickel transport system substrate-binding protein